LILRLHATFYFLKLEHFIFENDFYWLKNIYFLFPINILYAFVFATNKPSQNFEFDKFFD